MRIVWSRLAAAVMHRLRHRDAVSLDWLHDQDRRESRIEFHGVVPRWPIKKILNESALWNTHRLRVPQEDVRRWG